MSEAITTEAAKPGAILKQVQSEGDKTNPNPPKGKGKKSAKGKKPAAEKAKPEAVKPMLNFLKLPAPSLETVARKDITRDRRLQHRSKLQDDGEDGTVAKYAELKKEQRQRNDGKGDDFPPVRIVRDISDTKDKGTLWLYDGFQRVAADEQNRTTEVPAEIIEGTFADALMLSLGSNGENSLLPRTRDDARRSVFALLDNPEVLDKVMKYAKGNGGAHRVIANVCRCSMGTVANALSARELKPSGEKLIAAKPKPAKPKPAKKPKVEPKPDGSLVVPANAGKEGPEVSEAAQQKADDAAYARLQEVEFVGRLSEAEKAAKKVAAIFSTFLLDPKKSDMVRAAMGKHGFPIDKGFDLEAAKKQREFRPYYEILEYWPVVNTLCDMMRDIRKANEAAVKAEADAEPTGQLSPVGLHA